jgi:hypothetical protein
VRDEVRTGWLLCRQLSFEVADSWKIQAEVLARDASRLQMATAVHDGDEAARLRLGPATARWSCGTAPDGRLRTGYTGGGPAPTNGRVRRASRSDEWGKVALAPGMDAACRKMPGTWARAQRSGGG